MSLKFLNVRKAAERIEQLEEQKKSLQDEIAAIAARRQSTSTAPAPSATPPKLSRQLCEAIMKTVFHEGPITFALLSDAELTEDCAARIAAARLICPGIREVEDGPPLHGYAAIHRGIKQDALNAVLRKSKK